MKAVNYKRKTKHKPYPHGTGPHENEESCRRCGALDTNVASGKKFRCINCGYTESHFGIFGA